MGSFGVIDGGRSSLARRALRAVSSAFCITSPDSETELSGPTGGRWVQDSHVNFAAVAPADRGPAASGLPRSLDQKH